MRKITALILTLTVILTALPLTATADNTAEDVLVIIKDRIRNTDEFTYFNSNSYTDTNGTQYMFSWESETDNTALNITATADGIITGYHYYGNDESESKPTLNKKTTDEILPLAQELVNKLNPDIGSSLVVSKESEFESLGSDYYYFTAQRFENGIPVYGDGAHLTVSADGTEIIHFNMQYTVGLDLADTASSIDIYTAQKLYGESIGMSLCYITKYDGRTKTAYPVYVPQDKGNKYISAVTGEVITPIQPEYDRYLMKNEAATDSVTNGAAGLTPAEIEELEAIANLMTKEEAENVVRGNGLIIPACTEVNLDSIRLTKDYYDEDLYTYSLNFAADNLYIYATINAKTGEILSFSRYGDRNGEEDLTKEEAQNIAQTVVTELTAKHSEYKLKESDSKNNFVYERYVNDIPYVDDTISITVDLSDGSIEYYNIEYSNIEFPSIENVIANNMALKCLFSSINYELYYVPTCSDKGLKAYDSALLVYMSEDNYMPNIDAITGERTDKIYNDGYIPEYTDISGHYAEEQIKTLRKFGIGFQSESFNPDEVITEKDFLALLISAVSNNSGVVIYNDYDYEYITRRAKNIGIISAEDNAADISLTRESAAVMMVKALGFDEVASIEGIYKCPFTDVTENVGHISILSGLKVINGDGNGLFNPTAHITRADAAIMIYNYLSR